MTLGQLSLELARFEPWLTLGTHFKNRRHGGARVNATPASPPGRPPIPPLVLSGLIHRIDSVTRIHEGARPCCDETSMLDRDSAGLTTAAGPGCFRRRLWHAPPHLNVASDLQHIPHVSDRVIKSEDGAGGRDSSTVPRSRAELSKLQNRTLYPHTQNVIY